MRGTVHQVRSQVHPLPQAVRHREGRQHFNVVHQPLPLQPLQQLLQQLLLLLLLLQPTSSACVSNLLTHTQIYR